MINLTFASFRQNKENNPNAKTLIASKYDLPTHGFKHICEFKDRGYLGNKLDNQENNFANTHHNHTPYTHLPRKNMVKVDKSNKKYQHKGYKSPINKHWEPISRAHVPLKLHKHAETSTNQKCNPKLNSQVIMTPCLNKNNRSILDQPFSASFLTQKHSINSDHGSISSNKNSFDDSFRLYGTNVSIDEDMNGGEIVNSSLQLQRTSRDGGERAVQCSFDDVGIKNMKKSMHFYCNPQDSVLKELQTQTNRSVASSIRVSQKFRHYKKKQPKIQSSCLSASDFSVIKQIGSGKYGKVYLARHNMTGFICALKSVSKRILREQQLEAAFTQQIKIQFYLNHPNVVSLYGLFHDSENVYLVMEYCSGGHLFSQIRQRRHFAQDEALRILSHLYEAVAYIHCNGVIHRDIKPQNVVIEHGIYKLCDFGWAAYACGDNRTTFCGTPLYVCPEVLKGQSYNQKADVWGLGVVTYELTFGRVPFAILSQSDLLKIIKDPVYFPAWGETSERLVKMLKRMLSKEAKERPSLNQILSDELFTSFRDSPEPALRLQFSRVY